MTMLNRATPPEREPSGLLTFRALLSGPEETAQAGVSETLWDSSVLSFLPKTCTAELRVHLYLRKKFSSMAGDS
jgi:hypothetical protein